MWSTELWLITIGDNCRITTGVRFLTHNGGVLIINSEEYGKEYFAICGDIKIGKMFILEKEL